MTGQPSTEPIPTLADQEGLVAAACYGNANLPRGTLLGPRCRACLVWESWLRYLDYLRWEVETGRQRLDLPDDMGPPRVTLGQAMEVYG